MASNFKIIVFAVSCSFLFVLTDPVFAQTGIAPPTPKDPIVFVPGLVASYNRRLLFKDKPGGAWIFVPFGNIYAGLLARIQSVGYVKDRDLFIAHYDWRQSNEKSAAEYLAPVIAEAKEHSVSGKVDIVAHSMGGLIAQKYISSDAYTDGEIDQFIMMGTPSAGASNAYLPWEGGILPPSWGKVTANYIGLIESSLKSHREQDNLKRPISFRQFFPSLKELLPTGDFVMKNNELVPRGELAEQNPFLEALRNFRDTLVSSGITITTIAGTGEQTLNTIALNASRTEEDIELGRWRDGHPFEAIPRPNTTEGDQTVLETSALFQNDESGYVHTHSFPGVSHNALPEYAQDKVLETLGIVDTGPKIFEYQEPEWLTGFVVLSPVDIVITDSTGKTVSKDVNDFGEDAFVDMSENNEEDDPKVIILRNLPPGTYTIHLTGTGTGEYTVITTHTNDTTSESETLTGNTTPGKEETFTVEIEDNGDDIDVSSITELKPVEQKFFLLHGRMPTIAEWKYWLKKNNYTIRHQVKMTFAIERWKARGR